MGSVESSIHKTALTAITSTIDLQNLFVVILNQLTDIIVCDAARILITENDEFREVLARTSTVDNAEDMPLPSTPHDINDAVKSGDFLPLNGEITGPLFLSDLADGQRIFAGLMSHGQYIGLIILERRGDLADEFTSDELEQINILAQYASIAVANAQVYEVLQQNLEDQSRLEHATTFIMSARNWGELAQQVVDAVVNDFQQADCGIFLRNDVTQTDKNGVIRLERVARAGAYKVIANKPVTYDSEGLVPLAVRSEQTIYAPDVTQHEHYVPNNPETRSELVMPLNTCFGVVGAVDLQSPSVDAFSERDRQILAAFVERAALAFENVYLLETLRVFAADLEQRVIDRTAELSEEKDRIAAILTSIDDSIMLLDPDGKLHSANPSFLENFGYEDIKNLSLHDVIVNNSEKEIKNALATVKRTQKPLHFELTCIRRDGTTFEGDIALSPIISYDQQLSSIVSSVRDITRRKMTEQKLRSALQKEQELNDLKSSFIAMTSHEFRTPLATIQASIDLLRRYNDRMSEEDKVNRYAKVERTIQHMTSMLEDILTISRIETGTVDFNATQINIEDFVLDLIDDMKDRPDCKHEFVFEKRGEGRDYCIDRKLMRQAVSNLLSNAVKYSPPSTQITTRLHCHDDGFTLQISDQGIGVPEEDQATLFEAFHRASNVGNAPGTGLGLKVVKQAIDLHQGTIALHSQVGAGTTFTITIPNKTAA